MSNRNDRIGKIASILKSNIVLLTREDVFVYPSGHFFSLKFDEIKKHIGENYFGYNIFSVDELESELLCIQEKEYIFDDRIELALLLLEESSVDVLGISNNFESKLIHILENGLDKKNHENKLGVYNSKCNGFLCLMEGLNNSNEKKSEIQTSDESENETNNEIEETIEIVKNSINCKVVFQYGNRVVFIFNDSDDLERKITSLSKNLTLEMLKDYVVSVDGPFSGTDEFVKVYENCIKSLRLKKIFKLKENILYYKKLTEYVVLGTIDKEAKSELIEAVFKTNITDSSNTFNQEILNTIEVFFNNNLNISDTSKELYIHRNTLLYRLEKINKATGYDLKNFKEAWLFRLAWILMKSLA